jgi:N-acetyl-alpha-D-muramate 1-phosphate uridylyltransferase
MDALLLVVPLARAHSHPGQGDFRMDGYGRITERRKPGRLAPFVYTGVQILSPRVIRDWPEGPFSTNLFWSRAMDAGRLWGVVHQGLWFDIGSPPAVGAAEAVLAEM